MSNWDKLSLKEKAAMIKVGVQNGLTSISDIKEQYNKFQEINASAGNLVKAINENTKQEVYLGDPLHNYDFTQSEEWADAHGYYPDNRGHRDDRVKKPSHPTHLSRGYFKSMNQFDLSDKGFEDPNYTLYGLNDGGQDPQAVMTYKGGIVLPEVTVTPKGNYIYNSYDNIVNKFDKGGYKEVDTRVGKFKSGSFVKLKGENFWRRVNTDGTLTQVYDGTYGTYDYRNKNVPKKVVDSVKWHKALYNTINPIGGYPSNIFEGIVKRNRVMNKKDSENIDRMSYSIENKISHKVADAAWRKYNGIPYDEKFLPKGKEDTIGGFKHTVRLPKELEQEIPVDTNLLKERIELNQRYLQEHPYNVPESVRIALSSDQNALNALRKTYSTGQPVGLNEASYNSRNWGTTGYASDSPLNVLANYNVRYSPEENRMYYSDTYGFDSDDSWYVDLLGGYDNYLEGNPFRIRGFVDLNDTSNQSKKFDKGGPTDQPGVDTWDAQWLAKEKRKLRQKEQVTKNKETVRDVSEFIASLAPGVGELLDLKQIYNDAKQGNYGSMAAGIGFFLLPEALEQAIKGGIKVARKFIPKTKSAKLANEFNRAVSETKLPETKSTKAKTVEHKPTSTQQENLLTLQNAQDINRINSIKSNISEAERMGIPKGERNQRVVLREWPKGPHPENFVLRRSNEDIVGEIQLSDDLSDIARPSESITTSIALVESFLAGFPPRIREFAGTSIYDDIFNDLGSQLTYVHPSILAKGHLKENPMIWDYRRYLLSQGIPSENISTETLEKILSQQYQQLTNTMTGKAKGLVLWNGSPNWFDEFNFAENLGTISGNMGNAGAGNYFSRGRQPYGLSDQKDFPGFHIRDNRMLQSQLNWNMQPYLITDIKSMPHYSQIEHLPENMMNRSRNYVRTLRPNDQLVINSSGGMRNPTLQPTKFQTVSNMGDHLEFRLRRNTGIKSLFPHPDTFVRNPDGSVSILRDWNDPRVNYKHGGKLNQNK